MQKLWKQNKSQRHWIIQCFLFCIKYSRGVIISVLKINLDAIRKNVLNYRSRMLAGVKFCAVVKADAYGLGAKKICKAINDLVDYFAVSSEAEFLGIHKHVTKPILLLDPIYKNITKLARLNCEFCVSNKMQVEIVLRLANKHKSIKFKIHLAFNTGMNRFGFDSKCELFEAVEIVQKTQNILIVGIFSHFFMGNDQNFVSLQSEKFSEIQKTLRQNEKIKDLIFHISNTDGFELNQQFNMVRIGLGMFLHNNYNAFSLESRIVEIRCIEEKENVGYSQAFISTKKMKIAVVSIGYADGISRCMKNQGFVIVNGEFCKILAVCMDSIIIDVTDVKVNINDNVTLIGENGGKQIFVCDLASWCDTIGYEIMTRISKRVKRVYIGGVAYADNNWQIQSKKA